MLSWVATTVAGVERWCARMPDGRTAYVEPSATPGRWRLRLVRKPGSKTLADYYESKPTADECRAVADGIAARTARRVA